ncbi:lamin tail domain-containing protein [Curtobacterium aurantiacum]|uniref:Lamin tail domain-containing protein n=1 Tax=Curtobacterium aurantiacum TaxID=3236919 RepID=A0ABS5VB56_9MICO|nr:lamin tail domain-containing protein [Curtobacterium flaccumfaciens]MBT1543857.1 lamin tail domain-containing protein [Curtobacterium flaccumfaciens pv. flaccumfaciens]MBT1586224.1 lamin tail domain-containing protein [Curtobacterium flaccumfaciens pv. flaccumfaciens]
MRAPALRPPTLRIGAAIAAALVVATGVVTASPALAAVGDDDPAVGAVAANGLVVNEVESNGDDTDWVELKNTSGAAIDLTGYAFLDNDSSHDAYVLPSGSTIAAGGYFVVDQLSATAPGFDFGLGGADTARLYDPAGDLVLRYAWTTHAGVTYGRCADGVGALVDTTASTKGAANDCSSPVRINEVESQDGTPGDWVELTNTGSTAVDLGGYVFKDSEDDHASTIPAGTTVAAGGFTVLDESDFGFGLGKADSARLFDARGTAVDSTSWTAHASTTFGRNPDGTGDFAETSAPTKGLANTFAGVVTAEVWPGGPDETVLDDEATFTGDLSGLDWTTSKSSRDGQLWAVQNGDGLLYHLTSDGTGGWAPSNAAGADLRYADGTGTPDAEGVTVTSDDPGAVYVSTERNNDVSSTSRPSVLRYATTDGSEATLRATDEWNLAADFPGLGANAGLEGITWIPDAWLTAHGFTDERTGTAYAPSAYAGHGEGLFFVGVEGTASVYAYALMDDGSSARVATIATSLAVVADVQFDPTLDALWVVCDEVCSGRTALYEVTDGAFAASTLYEAPSAADRTLANEGFAISGVCTDGERPTFYADDNDTDGFSLRTGTYPCEGGDTDPGTDPTPVPTPTPTPGDGGQTPTPSPTPGGTPTGGPTTGPSAAPVVPVAPSESLLTEANRGGVSAPASARAGETITVTVGTASAGDTVNVWLFSTPTLIGTATVAVDGTVRVTIPADTAAGVHRLAVTAADGSLIGWTPITITVDGPLAFTGAEGLGAGALVAFLLLAAGAGAGVLIVRRRRRAAAAE